MNRNLLCLRYVDNRLWISEDRVASLPGVRLFLSNHFYGSDIALEDEPAYDLVGFSLDIPNRVPSGTIGTSTSRTFEVLCRLLHRTFFQWVTGPSPHHTTMCIPCFTSPCRSALSLVTCIGT